MALSDEDKKKVGGSDLASILGISPYGSAYSVYERIVNGVDRDDSPAMSRGRRLEAPTLDWYGEHTGRKTMAGVRISDPSRPWLRGSLDARSWVPGALDSRRPVEVKTAGSQQTHRWGEEGTDHIPEEYLVQCQFYMGFGRDVGAIEDDVCDVPALVAGDFRLYQVRFDADIYGRMLEVAERFWLDHVLPRRPPDPTALPTDVEALAKRFRRHEGEQPLDYATLSAEQQATLNNYLLAYGAARTAESQLALWEVRAKALLGTAPGVSGLPDTLGYHRLDWRQTKAREVTDWEAVAKRIARIHGTEDWELEEHRKQHTTTREGIRPLCPRAKKERGT